MIQSFRLTLYDFFGYLLPGVVVMLAVVVFGWAAYFPAARLPIRTLPGDAWVCMGIAAYFAGHLVQALGNILGRLVTAEDDVFGDAAVGSQKAIAAAVRSHFSAWGFDPAKLDPKSLVRLCDETVVQGGNIAEREIFIYREGFYRGTCIALLLLAAALSMRMIRANAVVLIGDESVPLAADFFLFPFLLSLAGAGMAFARYKRFAQHKVNSAIAAFLVMQSVSKPTTQNENKPENAA